MNLYEIKKSTLDCSCGWKGRGAEAAGLLEGEAIVLRCPRCQNSLVATSIPTYEDGLASWDLLTEGERAQVLRAKKAFEDYRGKILKTPDQLPELQEGPFVFQFRVSAAPGSEITISLGDRLVWREPGYYECYERFVALGRLLMARYGERVVDLVPSEDSLLYLGGDSLGALDVVEAFRRKELGAKF